MALVGGVNASATFAVLPLGVIWILTRTRGPRRRSLMIWWPTFTLVGTLWWLVPLFVMGAYSPPFLDFIETTSVTTFPTTIFDSLRGTSNWIPYVSPDSRAGNDLVTAGSSPSTAESCCWPDLPGSSTAATSTGRSSPSPCSPAC